MTTTEHARTNHASPSTASNDGTGSPVGTLAHGLVGGVVAVLLSFLPLSTVLGGGVAGYLEAGRGGRALGAGTLAGAVAFIPYLVVAGYLFLSPSVALPGPALDVGREVVIAGVTGVALLYTLGLGVLGGVLGGILYGR